MQKIRKGDKVKVMRGVHAGKEGEVLRVDLAQNEHEHNRVLVRGVNIVKKHQKPNPTAGIPGGIIEVERPISMDNVLILVDGKVSRVRIEQKDGKNVRVAVKTGKEIK